MKKIITVVVFGLFLIQVLIPQSKVITSELRTDDPNKFYPASVECPLTITETVKCCCQDGNSYTCEVPTFRTICFVGGSLACLPEWGECRAVNLTGDEDDDQWYGCEDCCIFNLTIPCA